MSVFLSSPATQESSSKRGGKIRGSVVDWYSESLAVAERVLDMVNGRESGKMLKSDRNSTGIS